MLRPPPPRRASSPHTRACTQATYQIVSLASISGEPEVVAEAPKRPEDAPEPPSLPPVNLEIIKTREERAVAKAQAEADKVNPAVTMREQVVFSELAKTMQCEWMEKDGVFSIFVMGAVLIAPPFSPETCVGKPNSPELIRVKKVLAGVLQKLSEGGSKKR